MSADEVRPVPPQVSGSAESTAALLVIHGIGEQSPYQTLDAFTRGLACAIDPEGRQLKHRMVWLDGGAESMVRLKLMRPLGADKFRTLDIHEFYWAGLVQGRITVREILVWLARTSLTPLRYWAQQRAVLAKEHPRGEKRGILSFLTLIGLFFREILRAALLVALASAIVLPFVYAAVRHDDVIAAARELGSIATSVVHPLALVVWSALALFALFIVLGWWQLARQRINYSTKLMAQHRMEKTASLYWLIASVVGFITLVLSAFVIHSRYQLGMLQLGSRLVAAFLTPAVLLPTFAAALVFLLRVPLVKFVGDIVLYVSADARSTLSRTRGQILSRCKNKLRWLLTDAGYDSVYVAGHSLGSVVAYDTINHLLREVRIEAPGEGKLDQAGLDKLRGLLTFGSPLDKVYYFFRTRVGDEEPIRAQLLSSLHGFRRQSSERDYGTLKLEPYVIPKPIRFCWYNVYAWLDRISGHLDFYHVDRQESRSYVNPFTAHMSYWNDSRFYRIVLEWFDEG